MNTHYDIVILGGGLVGLSTLLALPESLQKNALILDAAAEPDPDSGHAPPGLDDRGTALNRRSLDILGRLLGDDETLKAFGAIRHIEVSQQGYWGITELSDDTPFGAVANNRRLGHALWRRAAQSPATLRHNTRAARLTMARDQVDVALADGEQISARLIILADGGRSGLTQQAGITYRTHDYAQTAITFNVERELPNGGQAYERFSSDGPRALLPLDGNRQTLVWVVPKTRAQAVLNWTDQRWQQAITECFGHDQGNVTTLAARAHYPLVMKRANELARPRLALVGNTAATLHPVAGQGFNLHLRTLVDLAASLDPDDPGHFPPLQAWQQRTRTDQNTIALACHGLVNLFSATGSLAQHARGLGLAGFNSRRGLKERLARRAMGYL